MIFLLAFRNLFRRKKNTILLILLISFITLIFFLGNSLLNQFARGLRRTYVDNLTADLMIQAKSDISMNLFGANIPIIDQYFSIPVLPAYEELRRELEQQEGIRCAAVVSSKALMDVNGIREGSLLTGIEVPDYFDIFPGIHIEEGRFLEPGEAGMMLPRERVNSIETRSGKALEPGNSVLFTSASENSFKIREVPLVGIYSYENPGPYMEEIVLMDPQTLRALSSVLTVASEAVAISDEATALLGEEVEDLFGKAGDAGETYVDAFPGGESVSLKISGPGGIGRKAASRGGDWNFILLRLEPGFSPSSVKKKLKNLLVKYDSTVVGWRLAAGMAALAVLLIQSLFYGGIFIISLAGIISIVNIVLVSVFRRTREIGTLRALGASDMYIAAMIILENLFLGLGAAAVGIVAGFFFIKGINHLAFPLNNQILSSLLGQKILQITFFPGEAVKASFLAVALGIVSSIYPGFRAIKIHPVEAVRRG